MTNAALYISTLQNEDGGFGYQQGLSSNAYLTADIANILVDTVDVNPLLSYYLEDTFTALDSYLDTAFPAINELSASDLDTVYQHFYIGENNTDSFSVVPANDFTSRGGKEYLITYEVTTEDGQTIELHSDGFMLDGFDFTFMGDDVLFSMNDDASIKDISNNLMLSNSDDVAKIGLCMGKISGTVNGVDYVLGLKNGRIGQLYPKS